MFLKTLYSFISRTTLTPWEFKRIAFDITVVTFFLCFGVLISMDKQTVGEIELKFLYISALCLKSIDILLGLQTSSFNKGVLTIPEAKSPLLKDVAVIIVLFILSIGISEDISFIMILFLLISHFTIDSNLYRIKRKVLLSKY